MILATDRQPQLPNIRMNTNFERKTNFESIKRNHPKLIGRLNLQTLSEWNVVDTKTHTRITMNITITISISFYATMENYTINKRSRAHGSCSAKRRLIRVNRKRRDAWVSFPSTYIENQTIDRSGLMINDSPVIRSRAPEICGKKIREKRWIIWAIYLWMCV